VGALAAVVPLVAAHHERPDGRGYYRGLVGQQIPLGARIIAVADTYDELTHDAPGRGALAPEAALQRMRAEAGTGLDAGCLEALAVAVGGGAEGGGGTVALGARSARRQWPAGLTDREVEILRLVARGQSRKELAGALHLSEHTVRHHLEHIYGKLGVGTRVGATLFAVEHDLLG
jgi:DNA-binding CsgD family transcriptional regulator